MRRSTNRSWAMHNKNLQLRELASALTLVASEGGGVRGGEIVVKAQVPLAEIGDYSNELKAISGGRGRYAIEFSHHEAVPPQVQKHLVDAFRPRVEDE